MAFNYCALFALLASLAVFVLVSLGGIIPEFVNVFIVKDPNNPTDSEPVANIGVFKSTYDSSVLTPEQIQASGVPDDKFETPSLEFPLLFPGQENFVADVLPIDPPLAKTFEETTGTVGVVQLVTQIVDGVKAVTFDSCAQYFDDITTSLTSYFTVLEDNLFPATVNVISNTTAQSFDAQFANIHPNIVIGATQQIMQGALATCGNDLSQLVSAQLACINTVFAARQGILNHAQTCSDAGVTISTCFFGLITYTALDGALSSAPVFVPGQASTTNFCDVLLNTDCSAVSLQAYFGTLLGFYAQFGRTDLQGLGGLYLDFLGSGLFASNTLTEKVNFQVLNPTIPSPAGVLSSTPFPPCRLLSKVVKAGTTLPDITGNEGTNDCPLTIYFPAVVQLLTLQNNTLAPVVDGVSQLYTKACATIGLLDPTTDCPALFGRVFLNGAFRGNIGALQDPEVFKQLGVAECEDDETDNEKIAQAQVCFIIGWVFSGLTVLIALPALFVQTKTHLILLSFAGVSSFIAGGMVLAALFVVRSAPVYQGVGNDDGEIEQDDAILREGIVVAFAKASSFMGILTSFVYFIALCIAASQVSTVEAEAEVEDKEVKEVAVPMKAEEIEIEEAPEVEVEKQI